MNVAPRDATGKPIAVGDLVECIDGGYRSIAVGERRRVRGIYGGRITLTNRLSPYSTSDYISTNFILKEKGQWDMGGEKTGGMLHFAFRVDGLPTISASPFRAWFDAGMEPDSVKVSDSQQVLKNQIEADIRAHPSHRWLIASANTVAEIAAPPVRFRGL